MIARATDLNDRITGAQRTWLDPDGFNSVRLGKAPIDTPRRAMGDLLGNAVRFGVANEINVIGQTVEQATEQVDKFLDNAAIAHLPSVRIIHGHGTGALRKGLGEFLRTHPLVAKHASEEEERGGKAITVVELRG